MTMDIRKAFMLLLVAFILIMTFLFLAKANAASVTLAWDANNPAPDGYGIFYKDHSTPYNYQAPIWTGTETTCTVTVSDTQQTAFVARAFKYGAVQLDGTKATLWSGDSNEVTFTPTTEPPQSPKNLIMRIIQAILNWFKHRSA